jgi:hypothetical protein
MEEPCSSSIPENGGVLLGGQRCKAIGVYGRMLETVPASVVAISVNYPISLNVKVRDLAHDVT